MLLSSKMSFGFSKYSISGNPYKMTGDSLL